MTAYRPHLLDEPIPFEGTDAERAANFNSHRFTTMDGENYECLDCCSKPWHRAADYPCGTTVPRRVRCIDCERSLMHTHDAETLAALARYEDTSS